MSSRNARPFRGYVNGDLVLFWGREVNAQTLVRAKTRRIAGRGTDAILALAGALGFAALAWKVVVAGPAALLTARFWLLPDVRLLAFWGGVMLLASLYYRRVHAASLRQGVRQRVYGEESGSDELRPARVDELVGPSDRRVDIAKAFSAEASQAVDDAYAVAQHADHAVMEPVHLFRALLATDDVALAFVRLGLQFSAYKDELFRLIARSGAASGDGFSEELTAVLARAYVLARAARADRVGPLELLCAVVEQDAGVRELLFAHNVDTRKIANVAEWIAFEQRLRERGRRFSGAAILRPKNDMNRAMTAVATPYLDRLSDDLTRLAANSGMFPVVGRERETQAVFRAIEGGSRSVVMVGKPGVGKDAIIAGIAQRMVEERVPAELSDARLIRLNVTRLVAGATAAEAQERLLRCLAEIARSGNIVLVIPEVAGMAGISAGGEGSVDLSRTLATELRRGYVFAIATATPEEYAAAIERSPLGEALVKVDIPEPDIDDAVRILEAVAPGVEYRNGTFFSYDAIEAAVTLTDKHVADRQLPEKAIEAASEAAAFARKARGKGAMVTREDVAAVVSEKSGIPLTALTESDSARLLRLEETLHARVVGQARAVAAVAAAMRRAAAELRSGTRPIANFLFVGPTGVGKTELAKALAAAYFGGEDAMIRLDMSEYQDPSAINKLIGAPGDRAGGLLTEAVRRKPFALLLLDEIEKAHPDVLTAFLQVMDDGRLTDSAGRTTDLTNVILIATSNAGSADIQAAVREGIAPEVIRERLMNGGLAERFRPEFLNRFDDVVMFTPLTREETRSIVRLMLNRVAQRLTEKGIGFLVSDAAVAELADAGFDPAFGARPLRRVIQDRVENAVADLLLRGEVARRDTIVYDLGGTVTIEKAERL